MRNLYDLSLFKKKVNELNIDLNESQYDQFIDYYELLTEWNSFMNLTSITDWDEVVNKHFVDSISLIKAVQNMTQVSYNLIDIGTGAGFPGIPLKIAFPKLNIILLDSLNKRVNFLNEVINRLGLKDIQAYHGRAEDFGHNLKFRESFDIVVSRAVANLTVLSEYCMPFVKVGGKFICYKSEKINDEYDAAKKAINILGGRFENIVDFILPSTDIYRNLFIVEKVKGTSNKYPRKAGLPSKEPLS